MLETRQIYKQYQSGTTTLEVLRGVDFLLEQGGFLAVVGQSGSGKSTLLHVMGLLDAPDRGEVWLDGQRIDNLSVWEKDRLRNNSIGMVFQAYHLLPELTALENVLTLWFLSFIASIIWLCVFYVERQPIQHREEERLDRVRFAEMTELLPEPGKSRQ